MWSGYFTLGGNEVANSARALGYTRTSDCPTHWLRDRECGGLVEALGDVEYTYDRIEEAPWYDPDDPEVSGRFLGAYVVSIDGLSDSTRTATITEKNTDGARVSGYRHTSREVRARVMLTAKGMDALELGMTWLRNVLDPYTCGVHGNDCGSSDFGFFVDCPPLRGFNTTTTEWTIQRTNLFANPWGTSTGAAYWGATLGDLSLVTDMPGDITTGTRWTRTGAGVGEVRLVVGNTLPSTDAPVHGLLKVRASEAITVTPYLRAAVGSSTGEVALSDPIILSVGMNDLEFTGAMPAASTTTAGIVFKVADGAVASTLDFTQILIEGANAAGLYFDGDFEDIEDEVQYEWLGGVGTSQSTMSVLPTIQTPQTDLEYAALVNERRRYLHTVTCVSGPLVQETKVSSDKVHVGYLVEFTLVAGVPFVFGVTKAIDVPPLTPTVLQDTPFNLVTHPSAELSSSSPSLIDATGSAGTKTVFPSHISPAGGQASHPSLVDFGSPWNTYRYWMALAPKVAYDDDGEAEDPNIVASTDGVTWVMPAGLVNPIDDLPSVAFPDAYNSDPELVYGPDNMLWLLWRTYDGTVVGGEEQMWLSKSADGVTWTAKTKVRSDDETVRRLVSPSLIWEDDGWTMYAVDILPSPNRLVRTRMEAETMTIAGWTAPTNVTLDMPSGREPWAVEVRLVGGEYLGLLNDTVTGTEGTLGDLYVITSQTGTAFERGSVVAIPRTGGTTPGHQALSRATFVMTSASIMKVYYTGYNTGSPQVWNIFRTNVTAPQGSAAVIAAYNYSPNPSVEVNATSLVGSADIVSGDDPDPYFTSGQVTGELQASGSSSFTGSITGDGSTADSGRAYIWLTQTVPLSGLATNTRVSFNVWGAVAILGGASGSTIHGVQATAVWRDGTTVLDTLTLGNASPSEYGGRAYQLDSQVKPSAADNVIVRLRFDVSWTSSGTPSMNSDIQAYIDAIAVTVP